MDYFKLLEKLIDDIESIKPIGHHHLNRHYVYLVNENLVVKFFNKPNKFGRSISALKALSEFDFIPNIVAFGAIDNHYYVILNLISGQVLDDMSINTSYKDCIRQSGSILATIHKSNQYDFFSIKADDFTDRVKSTSWEEVYRFEISRHLLNIHNYIHPEPDLIMKGLDKLTILLNQMWEVRHGYLTHNDFGPRNIMVENNRISGIIDFEQAAIMDRYRELVIVKYRLDIIDETLFEYFKDGYKDVFYYCEQIFEKSNELYLLHHAIMICSWSLNVDPVHYEEGLSLLKKCLSTGS